VSGDPKDDGSSTPQGLFSSGGTPKKAEEQPEAQGFDIVMDGAGRGAPDAPGAADASEEVPTREVQKPPSALFSFPPEEPTHGAEEVVLEDIAQNTSERGPSSFPPPLGQAEGHDAWTMERMQKQSTVPPVHTEDVDRLRQLSRATMPPPMESSEGGALDLVDRSKPSAQLDLVGEMEELYALDDLTGALRFAELILGRDPDNQQALRCAEKSRERLIGLYVSKIGDLSAVPVAAVNDSEMRWLGLDHRAGFLLSRVDSMSTVDEILDICGMPRLEALKTLVDLLERGAIRV
jgi:hypothetical protein